MITLLKIKLSTRRYVIYIPSEYPEKDELNYQNVYANYLLFGKILIYRKVVFSEIVPNCAVLQYCAFGSTNWLSKRPKLISAATQKRTIYIKTIQF